MEKAIAWDIIMSLDEMKKDNEYRKISKKSIFKMNNSKILINQGLPNFTLNSMLSLTYDYGSTKLVLYKCV